MTMVLIFWSLIVLMLCFAVTMVALPLLKAPKKPKTILLLSVTLSMAAIGLYHHFGAYKKLTHYWQLKSQAKIVKQELKKIKSPQQVINELASHLQANPNSPKGWYLLGRIFLGMHDYKKSYRAFAMAHALKPENIEYTTAFVQASFFYHNRHLKPADEKLLKAVLTKMPDNISALNMLAINAYLQKRYQTAANYWEQLIPLFRAGSAEQKLVLNMIAKSQKKLGDQNGRKHNR